MSNDDKIGKGFLDELESLSNEPEKKPKKTSSVDEVESLLKTTLSEMGINAEKLRASVKTMETEKKKEMDEKDNLESLLEPVHKPHDSAHDILRPPVHETVHEAVHEPDSEIIHEPVEEPIFESFHEPAREPILESFHEPAREPIKGKEPFIPRTQERAEIFEKPKHTEKDIFPPLPEKKPGAARPAPSIQRERFEAPAKKPDAIFDAYADKGKKKFPVALAAVAAVVVIGGALALFVFKKSGPSEPAVEPGTQVTQSNPAVSDTPADTPLNANASDSTASEQPTSTPAEKTAVPGPTAKKSTSTTTPPLPKPSVSTQTGPATESSGAPSEPISPIVPVTTPRVQDAKPAPSSTTAADSAAGRGTTASPAAAEQPKKAKLGDLIPLEQVDTRPVVQQRSDATYPPIGRRMGIEGTVIVNALISETGDVIRTNVIRKIQGGGNYGFETASEESVKKWKFKAAVKDGVNVKTWMPVAVVFQK